MSHDEGTPDDSEQDLGIYSALALFTKRDRFVSTCAPAAAIRGTREHDVEVGPYFTVN
jgi:hypothetical protein